MSHLAARRCAAALRETALASGGRTATLVGNAAVQQRRTLCATALRRSRGNNGDDNDPAAGFNRPGPPPLPAKEQREFERLVREKANAPQFKPASMTEDKHPQYRAKPVPEFDGDVNPQTGEVGGPKNDPLRWEREWTYGGRSTDF